MKQAHLFSISFAFYLIFCWCESVACGGWVQLFNGTNLDGWTVSENPASFSVSDGLMVVDGPRAHAYYTGPEAASGFPEFVFQAEVLTTRGANSGIYFHTHYQSTGWPSTGYEAQINQTYSDPKKTGGLYDVQDNYDSVARDNTWFQYEITVIGKRIILKIDGGTVTDYVEPDGLVRPWRQLSQGTFAIQSHHAGNPVYFRNIQVRSIPEPSTCVLGMVALFGLLAFWRKR